MNRLKQNFLLFAALLGVAVVGTEIWFLQQARAQAARARVGLEQKKQERDWVARQSPAPTPENEAALAAELVAIHARIAELRDGLKAGPTDPFAGPAPEKSSESFFQLAALVEQARAQAIAARVTLRPDERFGFASYANEGPPADLLRAVHRQQKAVESLLEPLFEARPLAVLSVRRTAPTGENPGGRGGAEDFFTLDPGLSLRQPGLVDTEPVRLEFTGQTSTLRTLLNGLSALRHPVVVRRVEVEPLPPTVVGSRPAAAESPQPLVRQSLSKFAVIVEFILLSPDPVPAAP